MELNIPFKAKMTILALGPESAGNFSVYKDGHVYLSGDFGDLSDGDNLKIFKSAVLKRLKESAILPEIILTDLHPLYVTTVWGSELAKKYKAKHIKIQHHIAHIFSAVGDKTITSRRPSGCDCFGIAADGTGFGDDGKIWGGEVFQFSIFNFQFSIKRVGHLENQTMIGGDLAVREPARMLVAVLAKIPNSKFQIPNKFKVSKLKTQRDFIFSFVKKYYSRQEFEVLFKQLQENFNCQETSSAGRVLDAVSLLLGFCGNERNYKHEPVDLLEKNSTEPYKIPPLIKGGRGDYILETTPLFEYLIKNLNKDKKRLAATAQRYIAEGLYRIIEKFETCLPAGRSEIFIAGGLAKNKIISSYLEGRGVYANKKIPRGDAGISFGQMIYFLLS